MGFSLTPLTGSRPRPSRGFLHELEEDAPRGSRVNEGDEPTVGARPRFLVHKFEPLLSQAAHLRPDVGDRESDMRQPLPVARDESGDDPVGREGLEKFDLRAAGPEEGDPDPLRGNVFGGLELEPKGPVVGEGGIELPHGHADVVGRSDHISCLDRCTPKTVRKTSLISPRVAFAWTASMIAGTTFSSPRATSSRRPRILVTARPSREARKVRRERARSPASFGFAFGVGTLPASST